MSTRERAVDAAPDRGQADEVSSLVDPWPDALPLTAEGRVARGIPVWSLPVKAPGFSGRIEGRTTGGRRSCAAPSCGGWFIGVKWETGQQMFICSRGWRYDTSSGVVEITDGVGMSTTTATDRPNTRAEPPPRHAWPPRQALGPAWRTSR